MVKFYENRDNDGGHALWPPGRHAINSRSRATERSCLVRQVTLDSVVERLGIERIGSAKNDVEGAELNVARGANKCLPQGRIDLVICELCKFTLGEMGTSYADLFRWFYSFGYRGYISPDGINLQEITLEPTFEPQGQWIEPFEQRADNIFFLKQDDRAPE